MLPRRQTCETVDGCIMRGEQRTHHAPVQLCYLVMLTAQGLDFRESLSQFSFPACQRAEVTRIQTAFWLHECQDV